VCVGVCVCVLVSVCVPVGFVFVVLDWAGSMRLFCGMISLPCFEFALFGLGKILEGVYSWVVGRVIDRVVWGETKKCVIAMMNFMI